jgi:Sec-independent protein translocase protein TatA
MHPEKIWIVILILVIVLVGSNLMMLAAARGMRGWRGDFFKNFSDASRPWKKEDEGLRELNQRVQALKPTAEAEAQPPTDPQAGSPR